MNPPSNWFLSFFVVLLGLEFGSFANVCIHRWPRASSVTNPRRSACPWCHHAIAWADNIPLISFILLRGKCRHCASPISVRYPLVECALAFLWVAALRFFPKPAGPEGIVALAVMFVFLFVAVVTTMTDLDWRLIPDQATVLLTIAGLFGSWANPILGALPIDRMSGSILGLAVGGGSIWLIGRAGTLMFGREAMGGGDVKLLAAMGTVLGWPGVLATLFFAAILGGVVSLVALARGGVKRGDYVPFGPFLNLAGTIVLFHLIYRGELLPEIIEFGL